MDGTPRLLSPAMHVLRSFAGTRLESQLLASAYERLLPRMQTSGNVAPSNRELLDPTLPSASGIIRDERALWRKGA